MKNRFFFFTLILTTLFALSTHAAKRQKYNFNSEWRLQVVGQSCVYKDRYQHGRSQING